MWRGALPEDAETVLENQLTRLGNALWKATGLLTKWSEPMLLGAAVRFVKGNLDKEDIKDVSMLLSIRHTPSNDCRAFAETS